MKRTGFTLIELMIVLAIFGILASIAVPAINEYRAKSSGAPAPKAGSSGFISYGTKCVNGDLFAFDSAGANSVLDNVGKPVKC